MPVGTFTACWEGAVELVHARDTRVKELTEQVQELRRGLDTAAYQMRQLSKTLPSPVDESVIALAETLITGTYDAKPGIRRNSRARNRL